MEKYEQRVVATVVQKNQQKFFAAFNSAKSFAKISIKKNKKQFKKTT